MTNTNCLEGITCPACGNEDRFRVEVTTMAIVTDDGAKVEHSDLHWDETSYAECAICLKHGALSHFEAQSDAVTTILKPTYEILVAFSGCKRLRIHAESPEAARKLVEDGEWDAGDEFDHETHDITIIEVDWVSSPQAKESGQ